jgi:hypothetical protein
MRYPQLNYLTGSKASKHLFCVSKAFLKLSTALYLQFLRGQGGEGSKLFVT